MPTTLGLRRNGRSAKKQEDKEETHGIPRWEHPKEAIASVRGPDAFVPQRTSKSKQRQPTNDHNGMLNVGGDRPLHSMTISFNTEASVCPSLGDITCDYSEAQAFASIGLSPHREATGRQLPILPVEQNKPSASGSNSKCDRTGQPLYSEKLKNISSPVLKNPHFSHGGVPKKLNGTTRKQSPRKATTSSPRKSPHRRRTDSPAKKRSVIDSPVRERRKAPPTPIVPDLNKAIHCAVPVALSGDREMPKDSEIVLNTRDIMFAAPLSPPKVSVESIVIASKQHSKQHGRTGSKISDGTASLHSSSATLEEIFVSAGEQDKANGFIPVAPFLDRNDMPNTNSPTGKRPVRMVPPTSGKAVSKEKDRVKGRDTNLDDRGVRKGTTSAVSVSTMRIDNRKGKGKGKEIVLQGSREPVPAAFRPTQLHGSHSSHEIQWSIDSEDSSVRSKQSSDTGASILDERSSPLGRSPERPMHVHAFRAENGDIIRQNASNASKHRRSRASPQRVTNARASGTGETHAEPRQEEAEVGLYESNLHDSFGESDRHKWTADSTRLPSRHNLNASESCAGESSPLHPDKTNQVSRPDNLEASLNTIVSLNTNTSQATEGSTIGDSTLSPREKEEVEMAIERSLHDTGSCHRARKNCQQYDDNVSYDEASFQDSDSRSSRRNNCASLPTADIPVDRNTSSLQTSQGASIRSRHALMHDYNNMSRHAPTPEVSKEGTSNITSHDKVVSRMSEQSLHFDGKGFTAASNLDRELGKEERIILGQAKNLTLQEADMGDSMSRFDDSLF